MSTMEGSTRMAKASVLDVNTSAPALMALLAARLSVATSCHQLHHPAPTHAWLGYLGSAASLSTAIRAHGAFHLSIRFVTLSLSGICETV